MSELLAQWPLLAVLALAIAALYSEHVLSVRRRQDSDEKRISRYEDRDDRILSGQTKAIEGIATALGAINDSEKDWRTRVERVWEENNADTRRRLEVIEGLLRRREAAE